MSIELGGNDPEIHLLHKDVGSVYPTNYYDLKHQGLTKLGRIMSSMRSRMSPAASIRKMPRY